MSAYYNENDAFAAAWLRNLIAAGHIAPGDVDDRSIVDVRPDDLAGYDQCHFFAGIGGWPYALRLAGWPDERPVWTGSCPCQPFSAAGKRKGVEDERHLWPEFRRLIAERSPPVVFGEQVASKDGRDWLAGIRADLEGLAYAVGAADLCAPGVGAPHIRQRLWWVADSMRDGAEHGPADGHIAEGTPFGFDGRASWAGAEPRRGGASCRLADADGGLAGDGGLQPGGQHGFEPADRGAGRMGDAHDAGLPQRQEPEGRSAVGHEGPAADAPGPVGFWSDFDLLPCTDGKARRTQSAAQRMVDGLPGSLGRVRPEIVAEIEAEIVAHGAKTGADPRQVLRDVWRTVHAAAESVRETGERSDVCEAPILLAVLCQLAQQGWPLAEGISCEGAEAARRALRVLRYDDAVARSPRQRGLDGQQPGEPPDLVHILSPVLARHAQAAWQEAYDANARAVFPLAHGVPNRVGRLRAYGNAIVPRIAAEFIAAYREAA